MQKSCHLVALDKPFSQIFPLFIVRLSILSHSHPLWCLECKTKTYHIPLPWSSWFLFFSFFFSKLSLITIISCPSSTPWTSSYFITWIGPPCLIHTLRSKVSPRFHQLSKTKLGLSISPFLAIDDNLFTKIFNEMFLDSCCLPKHITMCKDYGQVSSIQFGSISSPYICAKSLDLKACTYAWIRSLGE